MIQKEKVDFGSTSGVTLVALAITVVVIILLATATVIGAKYSIDNSIINANMAELQLIQTAVLKKDQKEIVTLTNKKPVGRQITQEEYNQYSQYLYPSKVDYMSEYYILDKAALSEIGVQNVKDNKKYIVNWRTGEILSLNPVEYNGRVFHLEGALNSTHEINK